MQVAQVRASALPPLAGLLEWLLPEGLAAVLELALQQGAASRELYRRRIPKKAMAQQQGNYLWQ